MHESLMRHGAFGWTELMTADIEAAKRFYGALFGWETEDYPGGGSYVLVKVGGEAVGGMMAAPPECAGMPPAWGVYVTVDDADAVARQVETLGGKLLRRPQDIPDVGRFCVLQDPQGHPLRHAVRALQRRLKRAGALAAGKARALVGLDERAQLELMHRIAREGLTTRRVEALAKGCKPGGRHPGGDGGTPPPPAAKDPDLARLEAELSERLGTRVTVGCGAGGGGRLVVEFADPDILEGVLERLGVRP